MNPIHEDVEEEETLVPQGWTTWLQSCGAFKSGKSNRFDEACVGALRSFPWSRGRSIRWWIGIVNSRECVRNTKQGRERRGLITTGMIMMFIDEDVSKQLRQPLSELGEEFPLAAD